VNATRTTPYYDARPTYDDRLKRALGYSVVFHIALFVVFAVRAIFYPSEPLQLDNAIHVDMVSLPDKQTATLPPMPAPVVEPPKAEPKPPEPQAETPPKPLPVAPVPETPKVNLDKTKHSEDAALKRLAALERLEKMSAPSTQPTKAAPSAAVQPAPIKGNQISHGSDLRGIVRLEHQSYLQSIDQQVKSHWNLPQWLANANLTARVRLYIDAHGNVTKKEFVVSSRNQVYDDHVMATIDAAVPLSPPPSDLMNMIAIDGIVLEFN
jgi:outer membrane biosynthesis protein TonB